MLIETKLEKKNTNGQKKKLISKDDLKNFISSYNKAAPLALLNTLNSKKAFFVKMLCCR